MRKLTSTAHLDDVGGLDLAGQARRFIQQQTDTSAALNIQPLAAASLQSTAQAVTPLSFGLPTFSYESYFTTTTGSSGSLFANGFNLTGDTFPSNDGATGVKLHGTAAYTAFSLHGAAGLTLFSATGTVTGDLMTSAPLIYEFTLTDTGAVNTQINGWRLAYSLNWADGSAITVATEGTGLGTFSNTMPLAFEPVTTEAALLSYSVTLTATVQDIGGNGQPDFLLTVPSNSIDILAPLPPNRIPVAVDDAFPITEDSSILDDVLAPSTGSADSDADNDELTVTEVNGLADDVGRPIPLGNGQLLVHANGSFLFDPDHGYESMGAGEEDLVTFTYTVDDGQGGSASATVTITIQGVNDAPVTVDDQVVTAAGVFVVVPVLANDSDVEGDSLTVSDIFNASHGGLDVLQTPNGDVVRYTPNTGFSGFDSFTYTADDGNGGTTDGTVRVLVASHTGDGGNNSMFTTAGADFVLGNGGNDYIQTFGGADYVDAGAGRDTVFGGSGADTLLGGEDNDTFYATSFELLGDSIDGGDGIDTLVLTGSTNFVLPVFSFSNLEQLSFSNTLTVDQTSLLDLSSLSLTGVGRTITGGFASNQIIGSKSNDALNGGGGSDNLNGSGGNDTVQGGTGTDTVNGGLGNDTLAGNTTAASDGVMDTFVFNTPLNAATNVDQIVRFEATSTDRIRLDASIFMSPANVGTPGLDAGEFHSGAGASSQAQDSNDFILFDTTTGNLYYDADGNGIGARVLFASLGNTFTGTVDHSDFQMVLPALP